jgi:hypothetical protein
VRDNFRPDRPFCQVFLCASLDTSIREKLILSPELESCPPLQPESIYRVDRIPTTRFIKPEP